MGVEGRLVILMMTSVVATQRCHAGGHEQGGSPQWKIRARGGYCADHAAGAMVEVLREGEEAGVELVVLVGLAESSCGDVGKAHAVRGPGLSGPVTQRSGAGRRCSYTS